ncbi:MAG: CrcB family protein [bacterium]|nr:CrcB family protein [Acidimicrobiia bacterium]MCY4650907.1 CrcB family protein [bacterium]
MVILGVALAGGIGAVIRWLVSVWLADRTPGGTGAAVVNLAGSLALGAVVALSRHGQLHPQVAVVLGTGLLGALTTFSTWMVETLEEYGGKTSGLWWRTVPLTVAGVALLWVGVQLGGGLG